MSIRRWSVLVALGIAALAVACGGSDDRGWDARSIAREVDAEEIVNFTPRSNWLEQVTDRLGVSIGRSIATRFLPSPGLY